MNKFILFAAVWMVGYSATVLAAPATFADREREARIAEYNNPLTGPIGQESLSDKMQLDQAALRFLDPNMHCKDSAGNVVPNCGVASANETGNWAGGSKQRKFFNPPANGMRSDLMMAPAISNQLMTWLASPVNSVWTTFYYLDSGAAAGLAQSRETADGSVAATAMTLQQMNAQIDQDEIAGKALKEKFSGCVSDQLSSSGGANGNAAMAIANCAGDRFNSLGNPFATANPNGAVLGNSADWMPPAPGGMGPPLPGAGQNQHKLLDEIFAPLIKNPPGLVPASEYMTLRDDARDLIGDVIYTETISPTGDQTMSVERWRNPDPLKSPQAQFRNQYKRTWNTLNAVMYKYCNYIDQKRNINFSTHNPFQFQFVNFGWFLIPYAAQADFWASVGRSPSANYPTHSEMIDLGLAGGFQFHGALGDVLLAEFLKTQEAINAGQTSGQDPESGAGRDLECDEFQTGPNQKGNFDQLVASSTMTSSGFTFSKLKLWRRMLSFMSYRIALGQFLNRLRVMRNVFSEITGGAFAGSGYQASNLVLGLIYSTAGVEDGEGLEAAYFKNKQELKVFIDAALQARAAELGRSSGTLADMFSDEKGESQYMSSNNPMAS